MAIVTKPQTLRRTSIPLHRKRGQINFRSESQYTILKMDITDRDRESRLVEMVQ